ncbi:hypothetical protein CF319_g3962 [Tilletia indica]|nr:hypothetical protein CF319_g3962 [Tilletia indica]
MGRSIFQSEAIDGRLQSTSATRAHAKRMRAEQNWCCEHAQVADACQDCVPSKIQARRVGTVSSFHPCRYGTHGYPQRGAAPSGAHHNGSRSGSTTASATRDERTVIANLLERRGRREGADDNDAARDASFSELVERSLVDIRARGRRRPAAGSSTNAFQDTSESPPPPRQHPHYTYAHDARIQRLLDAHLEHRHLPSPSSRDIPIESGSTPRSNGFRSEIPPSDEVAILRTNLASHETEGASSSSTPRTTAGVAQFLDVSRPPHASRSRPDERHYTTAEDLIRSSREVSEENIPSSVWRSIQRDLTQMRDVRSPETHPTAREAILSGSGSVRRGIEALFPYSDDMDSDYELDLDIPRRGASPGATAAARDLPASSTTRAASIRRYRALARYSSSGPSALNGAAGEERSSSMGTTAPAAHSAAWNFSNIPPHDPPSLPADTLPAMIFPLPQPQPRARPGTEDYRTEPTAAAAETNADEYNHWAARSIPEEEEEAMLQDDLSAFERLLDGHTLNPEQSIAHLRMLADRVRRVYDFGRVRVPPSVSAARTQQQQQQGSGDVAGSAQRWYRRPAFSGDEYFAAERLQSSRPWGRSAPSTSAREEEDPSAQSQQGRALRFMDRETAARTLVGGEGEEASSRNVTGEAGPSVPRLSEWEMMHSATNEGGEGEGEQGGRRRRRSRDPSPCPTIQNAADAQMQIDEVSPTSSSSSTSPPSTLPSAGSSSREAESTSTSAPPSPPLTTTHNENATRVRRDGGSGGSDCPEIENNASRTTTAGSSSSGRIMEQMHRMMMAQPNRGPMPPAPAPLSRE